MRLGGGFWAVLEVFRVLVRGGKKRRRPGVSGWISEEERCSLSLGIRWNSPPSSPDVLSILRPSFPPVFDP